MRRIVVEATFTEQLLGTASNNSELHAEFIASKAPDAPSREEEIAALGAVEYEEKGMTVFPRMDDGATPFLWNYQWKGFFKESCGMLRRADGTLSKTLKAYKKEIDGLVEPRPRRIALELPPAGFVGDLQRPLRAQTAQGERVALAHSETVPAGTVCRFAVDIARDDLAPLVAEWLDYGRSHGMGQWRNAGNGRFTCRAVDAATGEVLLDNRGMSDDDVAADIARALG